MSCTTLPDKILTLLLNAVIARLPSNTFKNMYLFYVCACMNLCALSACMQVPMEARERGFPGAGVTGGCEPPGVDVRNRTWSSTRAASALNSSAISPAPVVEHFVTALRVFTPCPLSGSSLM